MNDELPFDDAQSDAAEADKRLPVTTFLLGAGFLGGLLCGLVMLASGAKTEETPAAAAKFSTPERLSHAAQVAAADQAANDEEPADERGVDGSVSERERLLAELETLKLKQEVAELQQRLDRLNTSPVSTDPRAKVEPIQTTPATEPAASPGEVTLDFWNRMNDVIEREAAMRAVPQGGVSAANAADFLNARVQAAEYAVDALGSLNPTGVDDRALDVGRALAAWYEQGREVAETGRDLMAQSPETRQGSAGKRYQADEKAYSAAVNKVNSVGERVRQELTKSYGVSFPALK